MNSIFQSSNADLRLTNWLTNRFAFNAKLAEKWFVYLLEADICYFCYTGKLLYGNFDQAAK